MRNKYRVGFYGGKFMPFHKGHAFCTERMANECEHGYLIMFTNGEQEENILKESDDEILTVESRWEQVKTLAMKYDNVTPVIIDCSSCKYDDGSEDWDAETPLVRNVCGDNIGAVYGSEYSYAEYFSRAYPEAEYVLVDPPREVFPISGTMCRNMNEQERREWVI